MLEDTHNLLRTLEEKRQSSFAELSAKHQKVKRLFCNAPLALSHVVISCGCLLCNELDVYYTFPRLSIFASNWIACQHNLLRQLWIGRKQLKQSPLSRWNELYIDFNVLIMYSML